MARNLPGLGAMKSFEAAARLLSFSRAAEELGVTPAAVSYRVRDLEDQLGVQLFQRTSRVVELTEPGRQLLAGVSEALDGIARTVSRLRGADLRPRLTVTTSPSFASKWLVPRLHRFLERYPDADVRIDVSDRLVDLTHEEVDIGVRFGKGQYPGLRVDRLFDEIIFPVCSPKLLSGRRPLKQPRDLRHYTLIHVEPQAAWATWPDWRMWLLAAGLRDLNPHRGLHFTHTALALQAAIDGQGVALAESTLVADDLASGRLVRPFEMSIKGPAEFGYYALTSPNESRPLVKAFLDWIVAEAGQMKAEMALANAATTAKRNLAATLA
ncbi:MAG TPA: transcriptional regulator GcvA [Dongiaceae bacterium]|nr:transcriptional regulator GcvA [Dongiaceae bacterium]